jgi:uncharacterized protein YoxC
MMSFKDSGRVLAVAAVLIVASLAGGFWAGISYSSPQQSRYLEEIDDLQAEVEGLQGQIDSLQHMASELNTTNDGLRDRLEEIQQEVDELNLVNDELRALLRELTPSSMETEPVDLSIVDTGKIIFSGLYSSELPDVSLDAPQYQLPIGTSDISNFQSFSAKISMSDAALALLERNGFVVIENPFDPEEEDITRPYEHLKDEEIPLFITSDSLLHLYHIQFSETLRQVEEKAFYDGIWNVSRSLLEDSIEKYSRSSGDLNEASRRNVAYFAVGLRLLQPREGQVCTDESMLEDPGSFREEDLDRYGFELPDFVAEIVEEELGLIEGHEGFSRSPTFVYREDYSQYVPRGHYTRSEKLKNYFEAMMWYGRMSLLLKGSDLIEEGETCSDLSICDALISTYDAKIQTMQACLIAAEFAESPELKAAWDRIYAVTSFYVGLSDDLGPNEYIGALDSVFKGVFDPNELDDEAIGRLKARLAECRPPEIYGGTGEIGILPPLTPKQADEVLEVTKGFRLMGQRFVPDSYMFQNLVIPKVTRLIGEEEAFTSVMTPIGFARGFPRGLDLMALLGSGRAAELLDELNDSSYLNYSTQFNMLREEFEGLSEEDWNRNLYWSWLHALKPLLEEFGEGYPTFMQTEAWRDKELTTALASWAELRHDTILYAKQSYTVEVLGVDIKEPTIGYVEPVPRFYSGLQALTRMTMEGLDEMNALDDEARSRMESLEGILARLVQISEKELENEELSQEDYDFIRDFGESLEDVISGVDERARKTTMAADVHTDQNSKQVLEEAVGHVRLIIVAYKVPDGRILVGAGPVMSYYEFRQPMGERLTDEGWREMLGTNPPESPEWTPNFTG